ncbi:glycosyltransferase [Pseudanabaena sp. ABRG5-3]|uniref:glycosyltransferase n=1 Tax=Pseudanabaena sp. ABRG5-3 TaxID=685565 RepID=UPI000DC733FF|nr:glycosyltransferase [Pseudanabaena sp. ABRG5-3]BBC24669.1 glycosyl transferase group 1 [Pseudanabaena sp. ABRG5-3]
MAKILILIGGHLCTAPRPQKEAESLTRAGHDVTVAGCWFDPVLVQRDRLLMGIKQWKFEAVLDFQPYQRVNNCSVRWRSRIAKEKFQRLGIFSPDLLGYGIKEMMKYAQKAKADLTIVHSEAGLWVGNQLIEQGYRVGIDFEDWFSENILPEVHTSQPINQLKSLESQLINECTYCITTSLAMAQGLAQAYQSKIPTVIYNTFPWEERLQIDGQIRDRRNLDLLSIHWFSQTIGQGRGLEILFQSLPYIHKPIEIHLRGNYPESSRRWLELQIPPEWRDRLFIHPTVPNNELLARIAEHDIGLALEIPYCLNKQLTISNKLFQYLQAGLSVIATDTEGQSEILSQYPEIGQLIPYDDAITLASAINSLINNSSKLKSNKQSALKVAQEKLNWKQQEDKIVALVEQAISN